MIEALKRSLLSLELAIVLFQTFIGSLHPIRETTWNFADSCFGYHGKAWDMKSQKNIIATQAR